MTGDVKRIKGREGQPNLRPLADFRTSAHRIHRRKRGAGRAAAPAAKEAEIEITG